MRFRALAFALATMATACVARDRPYRFASPMLGMAQTPPPTFRTPPASPDTPPVVANRHADPIRVTTAPRIREASAASAAAIAELPTAQADARATLPAPHRTTTPAPIPRTPLDLRALTGIRDKRTSLLLAIEWAHGLGLSLEGFAGTTGEDLLAWAEASHRLADATRTVPRPGDLLVFDAAQSDEAADLVAIVIARDDRGVTEMLYLGGGVIRRGYVDASRPKKKRDAQLRIVNSFIRHGKRWPAKGSHYLAGELLAHVIHLR
jgi:hypothetical protein